MDPREIYFSGLQELLQKEKDAERKAFEDLLQRHSVEYRIKQGFTWFPLMVKESGYGLGSYPFLIVERTRHLDISHQFGGGKAVELFTLNDPEEPAIKGAVHYADKHRMKIIFFRDELPDWVHDGKIGVNLVFDDQQYKEMEKALTTAMKSRNNPTADLVAVMLGLTPPWPEQNVSYKDPFINPSQEEAVRKCLATQDIAVIHGPPGTGKTTTLVAAIREIAVRKESVLVCCPSNAATDHISLKLSETGLKVVRVGNISRVDEKTLSLTLEALVENHEMAPQWREYRRRAEEYRRMAGKYKRSFGKAEREQRNLLYKEARDLMREAESLEDYMIQQLLQSAQVVTATLIGSEQRALRGKNFDYVIIDEAAQGLEPACWVPLCKGKKAVLAGDPFQLPPTIKSETRPDQGLNVTLIEKLIQKHPEKVSLLDTQYRMNESIMAFPNEMFYEKKLQADVSVAHHLLNLQNEFFETPVHFIDTAGCSFEEQQDPETRSFSNPGEAGLIRAVLNSLPEIPEPGNIAIISPYREQVRLLKEFFLPQADVDTIDSFQGQERDMIIISLVRSNNEGEIGFLKDYRRMNVAMTRARKKLVVIGDSATIGNDAFYGKFLEFCEASGFYHTAWEWNTD